MNCTCGAKKVYNARDGGREHSDWCDVSGKAIREGHIRSTHDEAAKQRQLNFGAVTALPQNRNGYHCTYNFRCGGTLGIGIAKYIIQYQVYGSNPRLISEYCCDSCSNGFSGAKWLITDPNAPVVP